MILENSCFCKQIFSQPWRACTTVDSGWKVRYRKSIGTTGFLFSKFFRWTKRKVKRKRKQKRRRGNLREGREAPWRRSLHPLRFWFRFRFIYVIFFEKRFLFFCGTLSVVPYFSAWNSVCRGQNILWGGERFKEGSWGICSPGRPRCYTAVQN